MSAAVAEHTTANETDIQEFLTIIIAGQRFGIPVLQVQDVLGHQKVTKIPLAPPEVAGSLNLRGRIVTAIDVRRRMGLEKNEDETSQMGVVVEKGNELYSLIIDRVGDVMALNSSEIENNPATLDPLWHEVSAGIYRLENELLVLMDIDKFLDIVKEENE